MFIRNLREKYHKRTFKNSDLKVKNKNLISMHVICLLIAQRIKISIFEKRISILFFYFNPFDNTKFPNLDFNILLCSYVRFYFIYKCL